MISSSAEMGLTGEEKYQGIIHIPVMISSNIYIPLLSFLLNRKKGKIFFRHISSNQCMKIHGSGSRKRAKTPLCTGIFNGYG
jgi:hypothetical protein